MRDPVDRFFVGVALAAVCAVYVLCYAAPRPTPIAVGESCPDAVRPGCTVRGYGTWQVTVNEHGFTATAVRP
jgi:hypothetical protein